MEINLNTLFVMTQGAYVHRDHMTVKVDIDGKTRLAVPIHTLESLAIFGNVMISPGLLGLCAEFGVAVSFFKPSGYLIARVDAPVSGNVLLRREQFRWADQPARCLKIARNIVAGKLQNSRTLLLRSARSTPACNPSGKPACKSSGKPACKSSGKPACNPSGKDDNEDADAITRAATSLAGTIELLPSAKTLDELRGYEGEGAKIYFDAFTHMIRANRDAFTMTRRTRRPPLDRINAMLGFAYALLLHDCCAALTATGLDPSVGFLHAHRAGKPSLALDLMEEFRPLIADRLVIALINRRQIQADDFNIRDGGVVEMTDNARKTFIAAYQDRKAQTVQHPITRTNTRIGLLPFLQAKLLARYIRSDLPAYPPCVMK